MQFLRPVRPGRIVGRGRITHRDGDLVFLEAELLEGESVITTATATARVIALSQAPAAA